MGWEVTMIYKKHRQVKNKDDSKELIDFLQKLFFK